MEKLGDTAVNVDSSQIMESRSYAGTTQVLNLIIEQYINPLDSAAHDATNLKKKLKLYLDSEAIKGEARKGLDDPFYNLDVEEGLSKIRKWGEFVTLAHPLTESRKDMTKFYEEVFFPYLSDKIDGIEAIYPEHTDLESSYLADLAQEHGFWATAGSDMHNPNHELKYLGACTVPQGLMECMLYL